MCSFDSLSLQNCKRYKDIGINATLNLFTLDPFCVNHGTTLCPDMLPGKVKQTKKQQDLTMEN